jgi:hypothetical protein
MAVVKNKTTEGNRIFWSHVESVAEQLRRNTDGVRVERYHSEGSIETSRRDSLDEPMHCSDFNARCG